MVPDQPRRKHNKINPGLNRSDEYIKVKNRLKTIKSDEAKIELTNKAKQCK